MGEHEGWMGQPSGLLLNGLLLNESTPVICVLNAERWLRAEDRTTELIDCIQPNGPSEERRNAVADYVQRLIMKCFPCQVFTFGSVPLKTYLPDGDIDLTVFSNNPSLKDTWATLVRDFLESEEKNEDAEFCVKEVQYIQAEVKIIKCLVENIVVDISFNQLGGLCTLCFLEEVDHLINQNHLFKRSIILIKAWCYYESRILGAHHGLISTYALETLVLYIFHVFNNSFAGPLEVLYRFLEFFSCFDWDNFCVSLWGPVPISSLPDVTPDPPRKDAGELLLTRGFLEKCNAAYADLPTSQENQGQPFTSKHFNIIDPLRVNNNLGRSVSKGNFFRIRSAFAFGAKRLAKLLYCPKDDISLELNQFFMNTWERHGSGNRPDAPIHIVQHPIPTDIDQSQGLNKHMSLSSRKKKNERSLAHESAKGVSSTYTNSIEHSNRPSETASAKSNVSSVSRAQTQKGYANQNSSRMLDLSEKGGSKQVTQVDRSQRNLKLDNNVNEYIQGKYLFARTRSSPELTETYADTSSQGRRNKAPESKGNQVVSTKTDNSRRKNGRSGSVSTQSTVSSTDDPPVKNMSAHQNIGIPADAISLSNNSVEDSGHVNMSEERASVVGAQGMLQEEQDLVNMISSSANNFGGQFPMPLNFPSTHLPLPFSPSMLSSIGYAQRNLAGLMPGNIPFIDPSWASNFPFPQGLVQSPLPPFYPGLGLSSNSEDLVRQVNENHDSAETVPGDADSEVWHERDGSSSGRFVHEDGNMVWGNTDERQPSTSGSSGFVQTSRHGGSSRHQQKYAKENRGSMGGGYRDNVQRQDPRMNDIYPDDSVGSTRISTASQANSLRSKSSSEGSWDSSSAKGSKINRDKKGMKSTGSTMQYAVYGKGKHISEHASVDVEDVATSGTEVAERSSASQPGAAFYFPRHLLSGHETAQTSGTDSFIHMDPVVIGPGSRQRGADGSGSLPFTFYPAGPPVPFVTMLPFYNFPSDSSSPDASSNQLGREEGGLNSSVSIHSFDSCEGLDESKASAEEPRDILNSDFISHWHNLQFGRSCQNPRVVYPSPVIVPPGYLQGHIPWDGSGRPLGTNVNMYSQFMNYSPRIVPVPPVQPVSDTPVADYPRYVEDMPRYRAGTGTYLPLPKASRDRHSSGARRNNNYNYDRNDNRGDRDGNWNASKTRGANRSNNRNQADRSNSRLYRQSNNESRAERPWNESAPSYQSQNGPLHPPNSSPSDSANVGSGMYQVPGMNPHGAANGPPGPPVVMFYPSDNTSGYDGSPREPLEFGSVGPTPMGFMGSNEVSQHVMEGGRARGRVEEQRFHGSSQRSSPDQPSSPHLQRRT